MILISISILEYTRYIVYLDRDIALCCFCLYLSLSNHIDISLVCLSIALSLKYMYFCSILALYFSRSKYFRWQEPNALPSFAGLTRLICACGSTTMTPGLVYATIAV